MNLKPLASYPDKIFYIRNESYEQYRNTTLSDEQ
jgi:hypothetical protein